MINYPRAKKEERLSDYQLLMKRYRGELRKIADCLRRNGVRTEGSIIVDNAIDVINKLSGS